jgi:hypothetical protein
MRLGSLRVATVDGTGRWGYLVNLDDRVEVERVKRKIEAERDQGYFRAVPGELAFTEEEYSPERQAQEKNYYLAGRSKGA